MKIRLTIAILIIVLTVGSIVITTGFMSNSKYVEILNISNQYENLLKYKNELDKINQYNQEILKDLENQMNDLDDANINHMNDEIDVIKRVINENKLELEQIITKLSQMEEVNP